MSGYRFTGHMDNSPRPCNRCGGPKPRRVWYCRSCSMVVNLERFWSRVNKGEHCWVWTSHTTREGYGHLVVGSRTYGTRRNVRAHRYAYELLVGPIPEGLTLDHLCRNTGCVNPAHLEPVTLRDNILRGNNLAAQHLRQTHCVKGHAFTEANTYHRPSRPRSRECRACMAENAIRQSARRKALA